ncbi:MAG: TIGR00730 family Rossman fold protein [Alphaproteobacteria bacterium]
MTNVKICVYCSASLEADKSHLDGAYTLGKILAGQNFDLVYGGGRRGLMGQVANGMSEAGGHVTGIIPKFLTDFEVGNLDADDLQIVDDMHERKMGMFNAAAAFIILPGGLGTLEELFEVLTWKQLRQHDKPIIIVNKGGFWQPIADMITQMRDQAYLHNDREDLLVWTDTEEQALEWLVNWRNQ